MTYQELAAAASEDQVVAMIKALSLIAAVPLSVHPAHIDFTSKERMCQIAQEALDFKAD